MVICSENALRVFDVLNHCVKYISTVLWLAVNRQDVSARRTHALVSGQSGAPTRHAPARVTLGCKPGQGHASWRTRALKVKQQRSEAVS